MPLPRAVPFVPQLAALGGPNRPAQDDPTGCWFACAQMLRMYYEGGNARPVRIPELENEDGTHKRLDGGLRSKFLTNESLTPLDVRVPRETANQVDALLTEYGPAIVNWSGGLHVSVVIGATDMGIRYHDPAVGANQLISAAVFQVKQTFGFAKLAMYVRNPALTAGRRQFESTPKELVLASNGLIKKYPLKWPTGWWRVYDGGTWYYYLAAGANSNSGVAMSSRSPPPAGSLAPPAKAHNTGTWYFKPPKTLVVSWKKVAGAKAHCEETFYNATEECEKMNATSTLYCPLEAKRHRG